MGMEQPWQDKVAALGGCRVWERRVLSSTDFFNSLNWFWCLKHAKPQTSRCSGDEPHRLAESRERDTGQSGGKTKCDNTLKTESCTTSVAVFKQFVWRIYYCELNRCEL